MAELELGTLPRPAVLRSRPYCAPAVVFEAALEAQAGSPLGGTLSPDLLRLTDEP